jgi:glycosyltransferase involved in cell wall biosynthesis
MTRVALLTEIPAPYRLPLFNALAGRVDLDVLFLRDRQPDRLYDSHLDERRFRWTVLPGIDLTVRGRWLVVNAPVTRRLRRAEAVILGGWNEPAFWEALAVCALRRVPVVVWVESTGGDRRSGRLERLKRRLLAVPSAFLVPGRASRDYLRGLGVDDARIVTAPNAVDVSIFARTEREPHDGPVRLLAVGRLAPEKGIDVLLHAADGLPVEIALAGAGPEEERLRRLAGPNVRFLGQVPRDDLPAVFAAADVLVLPSRSEPWGMGLNEAALAGLPLVATSVAGAAHELIEDGVSGFVVPPDDVDALRSALRRLVEDEPSRGGAGARSRERGARLTPERWADAVTGLVASLSSRGGRPRGRRA